MTRIEKLLQMKENIEPLKIIEHECPLFYGLGGDSENCDDFKIFNGKGSDCLLCWIKEYKEEQ